MRRGNLGDIPVGEREVDLFGFDPNSVTSPDHELVDLFTMQIWIRTSCSVHDYTVPYPRISQNYILQWGCYINFNSVPVTMQPNQALIIYLESRDLSPRATNTRAQLISAVERVVSQGDRSPPILPWQISSVRDTTSL